MHNLLFNCSNVNEKLLFDLSNVDKINEKMPIVFQDYLRIFKGPFFNPKHKKFNKDLNASMETLDRENPGKEILKENFAFIESLIKKLEEIFSENKETLFESFNFKIYTLANNEEYIKGYFNSILSMGSFPYKLIPQRLYLFLKNFEIFLKNIEIKEYQNFSINFYSLNPENEFKFLNDAAYNFTPKFNVFYEKYRFVIKLKKNKKDITIEDIKKNFLYNFVKAEEKAAESGEYLVGFQIKDSFEKHHQKYVLFSFFMVNLPFDVSKKDKIYIDQNFTFMTIILRKFLALNFLWERKHIEDWKDNNFFEHIFNRDSSENILEKNGNLGHKNKVFFGIAEFCENPILEKENIVNKKQGFHFQIDVDLPKSPKIYPPIINNEVMKSLKESFTKKLALPNLFDFFYKNKDSEKIEEKKIEEEKKE